MPVLSDVRFEDKIVVWIIWKSFLSKLLWTESYKNPELFKNNIISLIFLTKFEKNDKFELS